MALFSIFLAEQTKGLYPWPELISGEMQMNYLMTTTAAVVLLAGLSGPALSDPAGDADVEIKTGEALYKANCLGCHKDEVMTRAEHRVKDVAQLDSQVRLCDANLNLQWMDDDIEAVSKYLNLNFYHFPAK